MSMGKQLDLMDDTGKVAAHLDLDSLLANIQAKKAETEKIANPMLKDPVVASPAGMLGGITDFKVMEIPLGEALVGGFVAVFASELIDGFLPNLDIKLRGAIKLGGAAASVMYGKKIFGNAGSAAIALLLTFDGLRDIIPIDLYAQRVANTVSGTITRRGLVQGNNRSESAIMGAANAVVDDYYERTRRGG